LYCFQAVANVGEISDFFAYLFYFANLNSLADFSHYEFKFVTIYQRSLFELMVNESCECVFIESSARNFYNATTSYEVVTISNYLFYNETTYHCLLLTNCYLFLFFSSSFFDMSIHLV
jgi:hypothetical protein